MENTYFGMHFQCSCPSICVNREENKNEKNWVHLQWRFYNKRWHLLAGSKHEMEIAIIKGLGSYSEYIIYTIYANPIYVHK